jgi:hypothetical protein
MKIPLSKFESVIDSVIVRRGEDYFCNDAVSGLKELKAGEWIASVEGTEIYKVRIQLKGDTVYGHSCSCPYDMGPVCKHVAAVLFALRKTAKLKPTEKTFEQMISRLPRKDLNAILADYAEREPDLVDYVSARRTIKEPSSDKEEYRHVIRNAVDAFRGRHGYIGYWQTSRAVNGAEMVLDKAREFLIKLQPARALPICQCVLEEMVPLLQEADDSNGSIGDVIGQAFQGLSGCAQQAKNAGFRKELFGYLLKECGHKRYEGWSDWRWEFLAIAGEVVQTPQEREKLFKRIDEIESNYGYKADWSRYDYERATVIKMKVVERLGTKEDAEEFLNQHLDCTPLREHAIERALKHKNYISAKTLALDGLKPDNARGLPGLISKWIEYLLNIAEAQKDYPEVKKYALQLFLGRNDFTFYYRYKKCFSGKEWPQEAQKIVDIIRRSKDGRNNILALPQIYIREERWPDLMDFVQESNSSWALENFAKYLAKHFPDKLADVYEKVIVEKLAPVMGRGNYQYLCEFLIRLQKLGAKDRVKRLVTELSAKYSNRPAMLEELRRV